jgi:hypothetical protein
MQNGKIDVEKSIARLETRDPSKRRDKRAPDPPPVDDKAAPLSLFEAQRVKANYDAKQRKLDYDLASGKLIQSEIADAAIASILLVVRSKLLAVPSVVAPAVAALTEVNECRNVIDQAIREAMEEITDPRLFTDAALAGRVISIVHRESHAWTQLS